VKNSDRRESTIVALLNAALEILQTVGYSQLRTSDVSKQSGKSEGILFRYFPTKYDLVRGSLEAAFQRHINRYLAETQALARPLDRGLMLSMLWRLVSNEELLWTYEVYAAASTDPVLRATIKPFLDANSTLIDLAALEILTEAGISVSDVQRMIDLVIWAMQALALRDMGRGDSGDQYPLIKYIERIANTIYPMAPSVD
jgi:AcrR family transcriptional regulator